MPIYTRKGDQGETGLGDGRRVQKIHPRIEAVGTVDELNSTLGLAISFLPMTSTIRDPLERVQHALFVIGSHLALPADAELRYREKLPALPGELVEFMEATIDGWWNELPPLTQFILPGGTSASAALQLGRSLARRAERTVLALRETDQTIDPLLIKLLNRLSDFLFAAARYANFEQKTAETLWQKS